MSEQKPEEEAKCVTSVCSDLRLWIILSETEKRRKCFECLIFLRTFSVSELFSKLTYIHIKCKYVLWDRWTVGGRRDQGSYVCFFKFISVLYVRGQHFSVGGCGALGPDTDGFFSVYSC